tara:strand:+ start:1282 stop:1896 length:615 start_codon:yes stop_codon:yes gene_type:complete
MDRKRDIIEQGYRIIFKRGVRSFTVDGFSEKIHISKKTIYDLFPTKEALIKEIVTFKLTSIKNKVKKIIVDSDCPLLTFFKINQLQLKTVSEVDINKLSDLKVKYPEIWSIVDKYRKDEIKTLESVFIEAYNKNYIKNDLDPMTVSNLYMNIIDKTFQPEFFIQEDISLKDTIILYTKIMTRGIFSKDALKKLSAINKEWKSHE